MNFNGWKQGLVLIVIIFLLGVAFAPGITASREIAETNELNDDLVDITVGIGNHVYTVLLTPTQAMELESLIDQMKTRLDEATTGEKTSQIFDETVVALYELGVLPKDMNVQDAQQFVNCQHRFKRIGKLLDVLSGNNIGMSDDEENRFCLIAGRTSNTSWLGSIISLLYFLKPGGINLWIYHSTRLGIIFKILPLVLGNSIIIGFRRITGGYTIWYPSIGWIHTIGLNGVKRWDGKFYGDHSNFTYGFRHWYYFGVLGFTGIKINLPPNRKNDEYFILGTALYVKIREDHSAGV